MSGKRWLIWQRLRRLYQGFRHPGTPWWAKGLVILILLYGISPVDLIPDVVPLLGWFDDVTLLLVLLLEFCGLAHRRLKFPCHRPGRRAGSGKLLAERFDLFASGGKRSTSLFGSCALSPPGTDVFLLGVEFLQAVASGLGKPRHGESNAHREQSTVDKGERRQVLELVRRVLGVQGREEVVEEVGISKTTGRRYLEYCVEIGFIAVEMQYGNIGHPRRLYRKIADGGKSAS